MYNYVYSLTHINVFFIVITCLCTSYKVEIYINKTTEQEQIACWIISNERFASNFVSGRRLSRVKLLLSRRVPANLKEPKPLHSEQCESVLHFVVYLLTWGGFEEIAWCKILRKLQRSLSLEGTLNLSGWGFCRAGDKNATALGNRRFLRTWRTASRSICN